LESPDSHEARQAGIEDRKKPYHEPRFRVYADLRSLTEAKNAKMGKSDGAYGALLKTG